MRITNSISSLGRMPRSDLVWGQRLRAVRRNFGKPSSFAKICLDREVALITLIDDHAMVEDVRPEKLSAAFAGLLDARALCYAGKTDAAVSAYDAILRDLGRLHIGRKE